MNRLLKKASSFPQGERTDRLRIPQPALATLTFSLSLWCGKGVFGCYPWRLKIPKLHFKTTSAQSPIVQRCCFFRFSSSTWGGFFLCCLTHGTDFSLKETFPTFYRREQTCIPELNVRNFTPSNSEEKTTEQISRENKVFKVSNLRCGGAVNNLCHLCNVIWPLLRTNSLYEKQTVVFSPHTQIGSTEFMINNYMMANICLLIFVLRLRKIYLTWNFCDKLISQFKKKLWR